MSSHDGEIHTRNGDSWRERTGGGIPCFHTICGGETVDDEMSNAPNMAYRRGEAPEATCVACILLNLQREAEAQ